MTKVINLTKGAILGETQYYTFDRIEGEYIIVKSSDDSEVQLGKEYVEKYLDSADQFDSDEKITKTELAEKFIATSRVVMSVEYYKRDVPKSNRTYKADLAVRAEALKNEFMANGISALEDALTRPVLTYTPGELRIMKGYHEGSIEISTGRVHFFDMEKKQWRQVDPRTIVSLTVNRVKSIKKK